MKHCNKCGNNIPDGTTTCEEAGFGDGCGKKLSLNKSKEEIVVTALHEYGVWLTRNPNAGPLERRAEKDCITKQLLEALTAQIIKNTFTEALRIIDEHDPNKSMARKTSSAYWGNTLRKEIEDIINNITKV